MTKPKAKMGRPSKFGDLDIDHIREMLESGMTDKQMAVSLRVSKSTWRKWMADNPDFSDTVKKGKYVADEAVERSLFEKACGYTTTETKFATHQGLITDRVEYIKYYPPDTTACIFWLKNRQPDKWRDKQQVDVSVLDPAERIKRAQARLKRIRDASE